MHVFCPDCNAEYKVNERSSLTKTVKFVCVECGKTWVDKFEKLEKAKAMSFKCNQIAPDNGTYQDTYAWILYSLGEYIEAREWILKALLNGGEKSAVIVEHYGDILYKLGDLEGALDQWKKSKELGGESQFLIQKINDKKLYE